MERETPSEELLAGLKGRCAPRLGLGAAGWMAVERFLRLAR